MSGEERALRKLLKVVEAVTKGFDRDQLAAHAKQFPGSALSNAGISYAKMRDLMDAAMAARKILEATHDQP